MDFSRTGEFGSVAEWVSWLPLVLAAGVAMLLLGAHHLRRNPYKTRLARLLEEEARGEEARSAPGSNALGPLHRLLRVVGDWAFRLYPARSRDAMERSISLAGTGPSWSCSDMVGLRVIAAFLAATLGFLGTCCFASPDVALVFGLVLAIVGFTAPWIWLQDRVESRQRRMVRDLPETIDLISLCLDAGLNLEGAMKAAVSRWKGPLMQELAQVLSEIELGRSRREALHRMAERTSTEEIRAFLAAVIQAEQLGGSLKQTIRMQSFDARLAYIGRVREAAMRAPIKMIVPMSLFVLPAIFIVIIGPAVPQLARSILGGQ